ncbi:hypothetical protein [Sphingopyxis sp. PET50]|uniref:hypothetical protein n=1 Tax=Sphingopyxis sp. PET50 TaxID=2976533 RepID=UPI0021AE3BD1|nr:hypothetical protein [Sphingopyxis sp. PET50]
MKLRFLLAAAGLFAVFPASASTFFDVTKTCPVDGETFSFSELGSISTFGSFPDGMPFGSGYFPIRMPECPGNGLVMYREFTDQEIERLRTLIASPEYLALRRGDNAYYRAYWLEKQLVPSSDILIPLLMRAGWDAKNQAPGGEQALRYTGELIDAIKAELAAEVGANSVVLQLRLANAQRELKRFDDAAAVLQAIVIDDGLRVDEESREDAAEVRKWLAKLKSGLGRAIERRDDSRYPTNMRER